MSKNKKTLKVSYDHFESLTKILASTINSDFDIIYGVPRGGLPVVTYLSNLLNLPVASSRHELHNFDKLLIVDDFVKTGNTIGAYYLMFKSKQVKFASLIVNENSHVKPDYYVELANFRRVLFPWDKS